MIIWQRWCTITFTPFKLWYTFIDFKMLFSAITAVTSAAGDVVAAQDPWTAVDSDVRARAIFNRVSRPRGKHSQPRVSSRRRKALGRRTARSLALISHLHLQPSQPRPTASPQAPQSTLPPMRVRPEHKVGTKWIAHSIVVYVSWEVLPIYIKCNKRLLFFFLLFYQVSFFLNMWPLLKYIVTRFFLSVSSKQATYLFC